MGWSKRSELIIDVKEYFISTINFAFFFLSLLFPYCRFLSGAIFTLLQLRQSHQFYLIFWTFPHTDSPFRLPPQGPSRKTKGNTICWNRHSWREVPLPSRWRSWLSLHTSFSISWHRIWPAGCGWRAIALGWGPLPLILDHIGYWNTRF